MFKYWLSRSLHRSGYVLGVIVTIWGSIFLGGCNDHGQSHQLVVIPHRVSGTLWLSEHVGVAEAAERHGFSIEWSGPNDADSFDEQYEIADQAIRKGAGGILLSPNSNGVFRRQLMEASERRIPVVLVGEPAGVEPMPGVSFVLSNLDETGRLIALRLGEILHHTGSVLIVGLDPHVPGNVERSDAVVVALQHYEPGIKVVDRIVGSSSPAHAETLIYRAIIAHKEVSALVSLSADESLAAASALRAGGDLERIRIIGCDQSQPLLMLLRFGVLDSLLIQDNRRQGRLAVDAVSDMRAGVYGSRTVYVDPVLVTRENIGAEHIQQILLMHR